MELDLSFVRFNIRSDFFGRAWCDADIETWISCRGVAQRFGDDDFFNF